MAKASDSHRKANEPLNAGARSVEVDPAQSHVLMAKELRVRLCPRTGKILSLRVRGREWLQQPPEGAEAALAAGRLEDAPRFTIHAAWGADECYPSVGGLPGFAAAHVRDHGEIWGRRCVVSARGEAHHDCAWTLPLPGSPVLRRRLHLDVTSGPTSDAARPTDGAGTPRLTVELSFPAHVPAVAGTKTTSLEALYAFHALFSMETDSRLVLLDASAKEVFRGVFPSPQHPCAHKFFVRASAAVIAHPGGATCRVELAAGEQGNFGIWWCNNGWGDGREHRVLGLEPTTHPSDGPLFVPAGVGPVSSEKPRPFAFSLEFPE